MLLRWASTYQKGTRLLFDDSFVSSTPSLEISLLNIALLFIYLCWMRGFRFWEEEEVLGFTLVFLNSKQQEKKSRESELSCKENGRKKQEAGRDNGREVSGWSNLYRWWQCPCLSGRKPLYALPSKCTTLSLCLWILTDIFNFCFNISATYMMIE